MPLMGELVHSTSNLLPSITLFLSIYILAIVPVVQRLLGDLNCVTFSLNRGANCSDDYLVFGLLAGDRPQRNK